MKIGFFDSGLGGLIVMKAVVSYLPEYDYEFYGDTKHVPYGDKTEDEIYELTKAGIRHLFSKGCVLVIIACNTASAETLRTLQDTFLQEEYPARKILGVIIPMVEEVVASGVKKTAVIATSRTVNSGKYEREFSKFDNRPYIKAIATPQLVPLIESNQQQLAYAEVSTLVESLQKEGFDSLILGCTHYSVLKDELASKHGKSMRIFSPTEIIPKKLESYLHVHKEISSQLSKGGTRTIYLSAHSPHYDTLMGEILGGYFLHDDA